MNPTRIHRRRRLPRPPFCSPPNSGRGKGYHCHVGNIRFRNLLQELVEDYQVASRAKKKELTMEVVKQIQAIPGRFLRQDVTGWVETDDEEARLKVSHTFRNLKASGNKKNTTTTATKKSAALAVMDGEEALSTSTTTTQTSSKRIRSETFGREFYTLDEPVSAD
jgi:hypothetical protein